MNFDFIEEDPVLSREDAIAILNTPDEQLDELMDRAKNLRYKYKGNRVSIHLLTNARSGNCSQDCAYCAQSCRSKADIAKYKWVEEEKLYQDNDFVNDYHLSRHCIGLSGMKFTDEEIEDIRDVCKTLKEKALVELRYFEDLKLEEIAGALDENLSTVKSRLYRTLRKLRIALEE